MAALHEFLTHFVRKQCSYKQWRTDIFEKRLLGQMNRKKDEPSPAILTKHEVQIRRPWLQIKTTLTRAGLGAVLHITPLALLHCRAPKFRCITNIGRAWIYVTMKNVTKSRYLYYQTKLDEGRY